MVLIPGLVSGVRGALRDRLLALRNGALAGAGDAN